jgi:hypothetical protein
MNSYSFSPYFDDFDANKNYHKILFKPGYAVQARELTQLQTIIQEQIKRFGDHIFKEGSVVYGGKTSIDRDVVYVKVESTFGGNQLNLNNFNGATIQNGAGVTAVVLTTTPEITVNGTLQQDTLYIKYVSGSGGLLSNTFAAGELLTCLTADGLLNTSNNFKCLTIAQAPTGKSVLVNLSDGIFYTGGQFVHTEAQNVIMNKYGSIADGRVVLEVIETVVTSDDDNTLLDPANGSYNYAAPGADRVKVELNLQVRDINFEPTEKFVELMRYSNDVLAIQSEFAQYSELEKTIARRTFDESGNYITNGMIVGAAPHLKTEQDEGGIWTELQGGNSEKMAITISPGKAYVKGFEISKISQTNIMVDRARTPAHIRTILNTTSTVAYGQYILVTDMFGFPNISNYQTIEFFDRSASSGGTLLGSARVIGAKLFSGDAETTSAVYALYIMDRSTAGYNYGSVRWSGGGSAVVISEYTITNNTLPFTVGETINFSTVRTGTVHSWNPSTSILQLKKNTAEFVKALPVIDDNIIGVTSAAVGRVRSSYNVVFNEPTSLIPLISDHVKSLYFVGSSIQYDVSRHIVVTSTGNATSTTISSGVLLAKTNSNTIAKSSLGHVANSRVTFAGGNTININTTGITNGTILNLVVPVQRLDPVLKTKIKTSITQNGLTPAAVITLSKADIFSITTVMADAVNITNQCSIADNGMRDMYYTQSRIRIPASALSATAISVTYQYYEHSAGDFFCVDSYAIRDEIQRYTASDGRIINLANVLDFRPILGTTNAFIDFPTNGTNLVQDIQYYIGRTDVVVIDPKGDLFAITGIPNEAPILPSIPRDTLFMASVFIPPYTEFITPVSGKTEGVTVSNQQNRRYTMRDIGNIADRIRRIEEFSTLQATERSLVDMEIINPSTGLNRFKSGFVVDSFDNNSTGNVTDPRFKTTYTKGLLTPTMREFESVLVYDDTNSTPNITYNNDVITLPYTTRELISQPDASKITPLNEFLIVKWVGDLTLVPTSDYWTPAPVVVVPPAPPVAILQPTPTPGPAPVPPQTIPPPASAPPAVPGAATPNWVPISPIPLSVLSVPGGIIVANNNGLLNTTRVEIIQQDTSYETSPGSNQWVFQSTNAELTHFSVSSGATNGPSEFIKLNLVSSPPSASLSGAWADAPVHWDLSIFAHRLDGKFTRILVKVVKPAGQSWTKPVVSPPPPPPVTPPTPPQAPAMRNLDLLEMAQDYLFRYPDVLALYMNNPNAWNGRAVAATDPNTGVYYQATVTNALLFAILHYTELGGAGEGRTYVLQVPI